ncbi:MAG TPA: hypothetical protein VNH46_00250, partial [Gemmatimonadales bacterium]|nr:hypothetical protein [Gemmatimonadales bacterium]
MNPLLPGNGVPMGQLVALLPEMVLSLAALVLLLVVSWRHATPADSRRAGWISLAGLGLAAVALVWVSA